MFHKRLMKEFKENQKYVAGMVAAQWGSLLCNVALMYAIGVFLENCFWEQNVGEGDIAKLFIVFAAVYIGRAVFTGIGSRLSFAASTQVKRKLRELVYEKLMKLGSSYHAHFATSEIVQISTEGVEQLEIYFGKYVPQFFYSLLAPPDTVLHCWKHEPQNGGRAAPLCSFDPGFHRCRAEVCEKASGKVLGQLHGTRGFFSGKFTGTDHLKNLSGG